MQTTQITTQLQFGLETALFSMLKHFKCIALIDILLCYDVLFLLDYDYIHLSLSHTHMHTHTHTHNVDFSNIDG